MAVTDADYFFDWPVLPEVPSSLNIAMTGNSAKLNWEVHGGNSAAIVVERKVDNADGAKEIWTRIAKLPNSATAYSDSALKKGDRVAYRVRAINSDGESAYSNIARGAVSVRQ